MQDLAKEMFDRLLSAKVDASEPRAVAKGWEALHVQIIRDIAVQRKLTVATSEATISFDKASKLFFDETFAREYAIALDSFAKGADFHPTLFSIEAGIGKVLCDAKGFKKFVEDELVSPANPLAVHLLFDTTEESVELDLVSHGQVELMLKFFYGMRCAFGHGSVEMTVRRGGSLDDFFDQSDLTTYAQKSAEAISDLFNASALPVPGSPFHKLSMWIENQLKDFENIPRKVVSFLMVFNMFSFTTAFVERFDLICKRYLAKEGVLGFSASSL